MSRYFTISTYGDMMFLPWIRRKQNWPRLRHPSLPAGYYPAYTYVRPSISYYSIGYTTITVSLPLFNPVSYSTHTLTAGFTKKTP